LTLEDGLILSTYSPQARTVTIQSKTAPRLPGSKVAGFSNSAFVAINDHSYIIKLNDTASDIVARLELPYVAASLADLRVDPAGLYVGRLADDGASWVVDPSQSFGRLARMGALEGEYRLLGQRQAESMELKRRDGRSPHPGG